MHKLFTAAIALFLTSTAASAQSICSSATWTPPPAGLSERAFILGGVEGQQAHWERSRQRARQASNLTLATALQTLGLDSLLPEERRRRVACDSPYQGEIIAMRVRTLGPDHPYIERLAANQIRVLSNCSWPRNQEAALPERNWDDLSANDDGLSEIAEHDFTYLTGVSYFHRREFDAARAAFAAVASDETSAHQDAGRLMEVRTLRKLLAIDEAYALAKRYRIEADDELKVALDEQEDIIAQHSHSTEYAVAHLEKIFRRVSGIPIENEPLGFRASQANEDFDLYFMSELARLSQADVADLPHDWWLQAEPPQSRRAFIAVHQLAKRYDGIDWVQAYHASDAYDRDNTWFSGPDIDVNDPAYERVTAHAYGKWKDGSARWAMIVAERMTPDSTYVPEIIGYADQLRKNAASCDLSPVEYVIYARIVHHVVRVLASKGDFTKAIEVLTALNRNALYPSMDRVTGTNNALVKSLLIRGEYELIAKLESWFADYEQYRYARQYNLATPKSGRLWTAQSPEQLIESHPTHFMTMVNMISSESLETYLTSLRGPSGLQYANRARASEVLWMRGFVFGDEALMARAEPLLLHAHPNLKRYFRQAAAAKTPEARDFAYAVMVLRNPGLTPYFDNVREERSFDIAKFYPGNPIEGNWWCDASDRAHVMDNEKRIRDAFFDVMFRQKIYRKKQIRGFSNERENTLLDESWRRFRGEYGPFDVISSEEQEKLSTLPRASEWLAEKIRAYMESPTGKSDRSAPRDERIPESLHRLVVTTRYACYNLERGNATTSKWAYETLHRYYAETPWAAETPYWFDTISRNGRR